MSTIGISARDRHWTIFGLGVVGIIWALLFLRLRTDWEVNPQYGYGWVVPLLGAWLLWRRWLDRPPPLPGSATGAVVAAVLALLVLWPIRLIEEANPEWRLILWAHGVAIVALCLSLAFHAGGWPWVRHFALPICFLLISIPWPTALEQRTIQDLTRIVAAVTVEIAGLMGIAAVQHGNLIELSNGTVGVEEACSGVRSLQTSIMIALFAGEAFRCTLLKRFLLLGFGLAFAFLLNLGRTTFLVWSAARSGVTEIGASHDAAGLIASIVLFIVLWTFARRWSRVLAEPREIVDEPKARPWPGMLIVSLLLLAVLVEAGTEGWYRAHEAHFVANPRWSVDWPTNRPAYRPVKISETAQSMLRCDFNRGAAWRDEDDNQWLLFFLRWGSGKNSAQLAKSHTPDVCMPATGSKLVGEPELHSITVRGLVLPFKHYVFDDHGRPLHVFHCLWEDRVSTKSPYVREDWSVASRLEAVRLGKRHLGQQSLELGVSGPASAADARAALQRELQRLVEVQEHVASLPHPPLN